MSVAREPRHAGLRARIGIIVPSSCRRVEQDLVPALPAGIVGHLARVRMTGPHHMPLHDLIPRLADAAAMLADADCDIIIFNCTSSSMSEGSDGEAMVVRALEQASQRQVTTAAAAVRAAMQTLQTRTVALATPYSEASTARVAAFLRSASLDVLQTMALDFGSSDLSCSTPADTWMRIVEELVPSGADTIFLSCANVDTFGLIEQVEPRFGRQMVTTNQAILWHSVRTLGFDDPLPGLGRLGVMAGRTETLAA